MRGRSWREAAIPPRRPARARYEIEMISSFWMRRLHPQQLCPSEALPPGDTKEIEPALGSASSSPTIRYFCTRPSSRLNVTVHRITHNHRADLIWPQARPLKSGVDGSRSEFKGRNIRQRAAECSDG